MAYFFPKVHLLCQLASKTRNRYDIFTPREKMYLEQKMAWTSRSMKIKYLKGSRPQPDLLSHIRVDYDMATGIPVAMHVVESVDPQIETLTDPELLDHKYPSPTGLCSWHVFGVPAIVPDRPYIIGETAPIKTRPALPIISPQQEGELAEKPTSINTRQPLPETNLDAPYDDDPTHYCKHCGYIPDGQHFCGL